MSRIHYFQRYSSQENVATNNTLLLLSRINSYSAARGAHFLSEIIGGEDVDLGIRFEQQTRAEGSVPDGSITQESFKLLIEAKVGSGVNRAQLLNHAKGFRGESKQILLLLTKDGIRKNKRLEIQAEIQAEYPDVLFRTTTFKGICKSLRNLFYEYEQEMFDMAQDYIEYCAEEELIDEADHLLRIVPCSQTLDLNKKYGVYFQPVERGYRNHSYLGIYWNKSVRAIWKIDSVFDVDIVNGELTKELVDGRSTDDYDENIIAIVAGARKECGYQVEQGCRFFCGRPFNTDFKKSTPHGIQGARFQNLYEILGKLGDVETIAQELREKQWE